MLWFVYFCLLQSFFAGSEGYSKISSMFLRIEENLVLLVPVTDSSMAAAAGQAASSQVSQPCCISVYVEGDFLI